jgi:hypothetical protein
MVVLNITPDTAGWTMTFPNRPPVKTRVVAIAGDSIVTETGSYASARRRGVQVTTNAVMRLQDGKLVGTRSRTTRRPAPTRCSVSARRGRARRSCLV